MTYVDESLARGLTNRLFREGKRESSKLVNKINRYKEDIRPGSSRAGAMHRAYMRAIRLGMGDDIIRINKSGKGSGLVEQVYFWDSDKKYTELVIAMVTSSPKLWRNNQTCGPPAPLVSIKRHAIERFFERTNSSDITAVRGEFLAVLLHLDTMFVATDGRPQVSDIIEWFHQAYMPTPNGAAVSRWNEESGLVVPTWLSDNAMATKVRKRWDAERTIALLEHRIPSTWKIEETS